VAMPFRQRSSKFTKCS